MFLVGLFKQSIPEWLFWCFDKMGMGDHVKWLLTRPILSLVFEEGEHSPFFRSQAKFGTTANPKYNYTRRLFCVGVKNSGRTQASDVRVVVESVVVKDEMRPERSLNIYDADEGIDARAIGPRQDTPLIFWEFVEEFVSREQEDTDWAYFCYARSVNECVAVFGKTLITLRVEGIGARPERMKFVLQKRKPGLDGEPIKTQLIVRRFMP